MSLFLWFLFLCLREGLGLPRHCSSGIGRAHCQNGEGLSGDRGVFWNPFEAGLMNLFRGSVEDNLLDTPEDSDQSAKGFGPHTLSPKFCGKRPLFDASTTKRIVGK